MFKQYPNIGKSLVLFSVLVTSQVLQGATITIVNGDGVGEGLNDSTPVSPIGGNPETTLGKQRLYAFEAAAAVLGKRLRSDVEIKIQANFDNLFDPGKDCTSGYTLGYAGPKGFFVNFTNAPQSNTYYVPAIASSYVGSDVNTSNVDVSATFNGEVDKDPSCVNSRFYYGIDDPSTVSGNVGTWFYGVILHEMMHGLGFLSIVNKSEGTFSNNILDSYSKNLAYIPGSTAQSWTTLSNSSRAQSIVSNNRLVWTGAQVTGSHNKTAGVNGGYVQIYAPTTIAPGSSTSHFDTAVTPNELMEPFNTNSIGVDLTIAAAKDFGWRVNFNNPQLSIPAQTITSGQSLSLNLNNFASDADNDTLTYSVGSKPGNLSALSVSGSTLTATPKSTYTGTLTFTVFASDGAASTSQTLSLTVNPAAGNNTAPSITAISDQSTRKATAKNVTISATDAESDPISFSASSSSSSVTTAISGSGNSRTLTLTPSASFTGTAIITVTASDGSNSSDEDFVLTVFDGLSVTTAATSVTNGQSLTISATSSWPFSVAAGSGNYSFALTFDGSDVSSLISSTGSGSYKIARPSSGAFAGSYSLTITDDDYGDTFSVTLVRPLEVSLSSQQIIKEAKRFKLQATGAEAGSVLSVSVTGTGATLYDAETAGTATNSMTASNSAATYNPAILWGQAETVTSNQSLSYSVGSTQYATVSAGSVQVIPSDEYQIKVTDLATGDPLNQAKVSFNDGRYAAWGVSTNALTNAQGLVTLPLATDTSYTMTVSKAGYQSKTLTVDHSSTNLAVALLSDPNVAIFFGTITASGSINFLNSSPIVNLIAGGLPFLGSSTVNSATSANYEVSVDTSQSYPQRLEVEVGAKTAGKVDIGSFSRSNEINLKVQDSDSTTTTDDDDSGITLTEDLNEDSASSSGGGSITGFYLFCLLGLICLSFNGMIRRNIAR